MNFRKITRYLFLAVAATFVLSSPTYAKNMSYTHGHNYIYSGDAIFPICWDLRTGYQMLRHYSNNYLTSLGWATSFYESFLDAALSSGVNTILIRTEPRLAAEWNDMTHLMYVAETARSKGLNIILGGIVNHGGDITDPNSINNKVLLTLNRYGIRSDSNLPGQWIGVHGYDEPDGSGYSLLADLTAASTHVNIVLGKRFGTFLAYPAESVPSLEAPYTSTVPGEEQAVTFSFWQQLGFGIFDWYPSMVWFGNSEINLTGSEVMLSGVSDLLPSKDGYYSAYTTRDEFWTITREMPPGYQDYVTVMRVYSIEGEETVGDLNLVYEDSLHIRTPWPFVTTSSSILSNDCGSRDDQTHNLSSAVVCWNPGGELHPDARVVINDGENILKDTFPHNIGAESYTNVLFSVGEIDYQRSRTPGGLCTGVIGHSDLRILWVAQHKTSGAYAISLFGKNNLGNDIKLKSSPPDDSSMQLPSGFVPEAAAWGRFWTDGYPHRRSGFILYNSNGDYVVVYDVIDAPIETWLVSGIYQNLFGPGYHGNAVTAYRNLGDIHLTPANDQIVAVVAPNNNPDNMSLLHGSLAWNSSSPGLIDYNDLYSCPLNDFNFTSPGDVSRIAVETVGRPGPRFYFAFHGGGYEFSPYLDGFSETTQQAIHKAGASQWRLVDPVRSRHTKRAYADVLLQSHINPYLFSMKNGNTSLVSGSGPNAPSREMLYANMVSYADQAVGHSSGAYDLQFEYGVASTPRSNVLIANVQSFGRAMQSSVRTFPGVYTPGVTPDSDLLYLALAPVIHGARGLSFYGLDLALWSGPVGDNSCSQAIRVPDVLTSWGAGPDGPVSINMVSRVHEAVSIITGSNHQSNPDFTNVILDDVRYSIISESSAFNSTGPQGAPVLDSYRVNFIAFFDEVTEDIYLIVSRDHPGNYAPWIVFPNINGSEYGDIECYGGWNPQSTALTNGSHGANAVIIPTADAPQSSAGLAIDFTSMPLYSASLLRIPKQARRFSSVHNETSIRNAHLEHVVMQGGNAVFRVVSDSDSRSSLRVYDVAGRCVEAVDDIRELGEFFNLSSLSIPPGIYYLVVSNNSYNTQVLRAMVL